MSKDYFSINGRAIRDGLNPYIIAEIGVNHGGDMELAKRLVREAKQGGAHAVKFQSYKAETIASRHSPAYWDTSKEATPSQYQLVKKYDRFGAAEYEALARFCAEVGIDFSSTPFDLGAVDFLNPLVPFFTIASADITNVPPLRKVAGTGKPVILSTGASTLPEVAHAVETLQAAGATELALLHCVLNYPTPRENAQLNGIALLRRAFPGVAIGYSDHVVPDATISALEAATLLGACILEKHFTHDKTLPGNDHYHAMDCNDLARFNEKLAVYRELVGEGRTLDHEAPARLHARRSIVAARDIKAGETLNEDMLIAKRPGHGISPVHWDDIIGRQATCDIAEDALLAWHMVGEAGA